jgi:hypothetical protein
MLFSNKSDEKIFMYAELERMGKKTGMPYLFHYYPVIYTHIAKPHFSLTAYSVLVNVTVSGI